LVEHNSILDYFLVALSAVTSWFTGESGRVIVASGFGGMMRWFASEKRRLGDGIVAVLCGCIVGKYMWPLVLSMPEFVGGSAFSETPNNVAMAAFVAGTMGMSGVKIGMAFVHSYLARLKVREDGANE
jgi:hypothetical protein